MRSCPCRLRRRCARSSGERLRGCGGYRATSSDRGRTWRGRDVEPHACTLSRTALRALPQHVAQHIRLHAITMEHGVLAALGDGEPGPRGWNSRAVMSLFCDAAWAYLVRDWMPAVPAEAKRASGWQRAAALRTESALAPTGLEAMLTRRLRRWWPREAVEVSGTADRDRACACCVRGAWRCGTDCAPHV